VRFFWMSLSPGIDRSWASKSPSSSATHSTGCTLKFDNRAHVPAQAVAVNKNVAHVPAVQLVS
jgi:hypothetical protein